MGDERRRIYARYLRTLDDYKDAKAEEAKAAANHAALLAAGASDDAQARALGDSYKALSELAGRCLELSSRKIEQTYEILFLASDDVGNLAVRLGEALGDDGDDAKASKLWSEFLSKARRDIGA